MPQRQRNTATIRVSKNTYENLDTVNPPSSGVPDEVWFDMPLGKRLDHLVRVAVQEAQDPQT